MTNKQNNPRAAALASIMAWEKNGRYANLEVNAALNTSALSDADRGLYTALVYGVIERLITLDHRIATLSNRPTAQIDREALNALRIGLYQLTYMDRIPPHAAVSESVSLVSARSRGFVNALLRTHLREGCRIPKPYGTDADQMSVEYSAPAELCRFFLEKYGKETAAAILSSSLRNPPITLRINPLKTTAEEVLVRHKDDGASLSPLSTDLITITDGTHITDGIRGGLYFVQDAASRLCVRVLDPQPGETGIDTCAAPGGKTLSAALDMLNTGKLYAFDLHENKVSLISRTAASLGISIVETAARDARNPHPDLLGKADRVLCDAPCSGLGVIAKKPDIKYKPLDSILALPEIQYDVLTGAAAYVRPGGTLVYSTCTLNPSENEEVVARFLAANSDFTAVEFDLGAAGTSVCGMRTRLPHKDGCDGFFIAKMIRKNL